MSDRDQETKKLGWQLFIANVCITAIWITIWATQDRITKAERKIESLEHRVDLLTPSASKP
jgi:hypothetical protein